MTDQEQQGRHRAAARLLLEVRRLILRQKGDGQITLAKGDGVQVLFAVQIGDDHWLCAHHCEHVGLLAEHALAKAVWFHPLFRLSVRCFARLAQGASQRGDLVEPRIVIAVVPNQDDSLTAPVAHGLEGGILADKPMDARRQELTHRFADALHNIGF